MKRDKIVGNHAEFEVAIMNGAIALLDEILGQDVFEIHGTGENQNISFKNRIAQRYFYLSLIDFLSDIDSSFKLAKDKCTVLSGLVHISCNPQIGYKKDIKSLKKHLRLFEKWLAKKVTVKKFWSPKINRETRLLLSRFDMIKICANMSKHGILRLGGIALDTQAIFQNSEIAISFNEAILCLEDFYEKFHNDILIYHASYIAEMLLCVRSAINEYLTPIYRRHLRNKEGYRGIPSYEYKIPKELQNDTVKVMFWDTMNTVRSGQKLRKMKTWKYLKLRF